ncbi:MAG: hypothetical protein HGA85_07080 [Nanoarchaeota archaeon]|nr:hypothetical protein [Nanoarchaeota archaeon]
MLDILKIPEQTDLSYTASELDALHVNSFSYGASFVSGLGGADFVRQAAREMLKTPLDRDTLSYRREFFHGIMTDSRLSDLLKLLSKDLPSGTLYQPTGFSGGLDEVALRAERYLNVPFLLEEIVKHSSTIKACRDLKRFAIEFQSGHADFISQAHSLGRTSPPRTKMKNRTENNPDNTYKVIEKLSRYNDLITKTMIDLGRQVNTYLIFAYLCQEGAFPEFTDKPAEGHILGAYHHGYSEWMHGGITQWKKPVKNDIHWDRKRRLNLITGYNSGGKSVYLRTAGIDVLLAMNGFYALADEMTLSPMRRIWCSFDTGDAPGMGHLQAGLSYISRMRDNAAYDGSDLILMDEPAQGTEPAVTKTLAKGVIENLVYKGRFPSFVVTHDLSIVDELKDMPGVHCLRLHDFDDDVKYKVYPGVAVGGYGMRIAESLGVDPVSLARSTKAKVAGSRGS